MKQRLLAIFLPNRSIDRKMALFLVAVWAGIGLLVWVMSPFATLPRPMEVWRGLSEVWWEHGMGPELFTTMKLIFHALFFTVVISLLLSYATVIAAMRPLVEAVSKLRFLGLTGLVVPFTLMTGGGYTLKVALLTFGMTVFFVTAMAQVVVEIPRQNFDHMRVLGAGELRILWEVVIRGTLDKALDCMRQNLAMGWMMITMVEGISRTEGGVGARLLELNRLFYLDKVFAVLFLILIVGLILDYAAGILSRILCPHAHLRRMH
jgi:NitT/TauT family transport system permease protein